MLRWIFLAIVAALVLSWLFSLRLPWLEKLGLTRLSSEWSFRLFGRVWRIPVTYMVIVPVCLFLLGYLLYFQ